jgi:hypothetical protein
MLRKRPLPARVQRTTLRSTRGKVGNMNEHTRLSIRAGGCVAICTTHWDRSELERWLMNVSASDEVLGLISMFPDSRLLPVTCIISVKGRGDIAELMRSVLSNTSDSKNVIMSTSDVEWGRSWGFTDIGLAGNKIMMMLNNY